MCCPAMKRRSKERQMSGLVLEESPTTGDEIITNYTINFGPQHPPRTACCAW
jgi:hypothetical protein